MTDEEWPTKCPECESENIKWENKQEYTGGGYADYWTEFSCKHCGYSWRSEVNTSLF